MWWTISCEVSVVTSAPSRANKEAIVVSKRLIEAHNWLVVNIIRAS